MLRIVYIVCLFLIGANYPLRAQLAQALRIEIPSNPNEAESFDITPLDERGVLMTIRTGGFYDNTPITFHFKKYDVNLKLLWQTAFKQDIRLRPIQTYNTDQHVSSFSRIRHRSVPVSSAAPR